MTDKIRITEDRVISRSKGKVKFYADDGSIKTDSAKTVLVYDTQEELDQAILDEGMAENEAAQQADEDSQEAQVGSDEQISNDEQVSDTEATAAATRSSKSKRSKAKGKEQMATKKKAAGKKAASKTATKKTSDGALIRTVAGREHDISGYEKVKNASGHTSYDNGDDVATKLRGKTLEEVYAYASKQLKEPEKDLRAKYKHLNSGMQRMSLGNRLRKVANDKAAA